MTPEIMIIYLGIISLIGLLALWWAKSTLIRIKSNRSKRVRKLDNFDSIETSAPAEYGKLGEIDAAVENIENRFSIIGKITFFLILIIWGVALAFPFLNSIPAALISVLVAVLSVVLGIAARPLIENIIAGMVMSFSKAVRVGDTVIIDDHYGTVEDISLNHTIIKLWNWKRLIIPSSKMLSKEVMSLTYHDSYIWVHISFYVSYDTSLEQVKQMAIEAVQESKNYVSQEPPGFWVMEMEKDAYQCWIAGWTNSATKAWNLASDIRTGIAIKFQSNGIRAQRFTVDMSPQSNKS
ncbi:MAG: mechanosensitive ion channel [Gammaproteobacteria bacterium]|nr:mechanosensitive ion channel [Gammaproteobacteria bacterium]